MRPLRKLSLSKMFHSYPMTSLRNDNMAYLFGPRLHTGFDTQNNWTTLVFSKCHKGLFDVPHRLVTLRLVGMAVMCSEHTE